MDHELIGTTLEEQRKLAVAIWDAAGKPGRKEEVWLDFPKGVKSKDLATTFVNVGRMDAPAFRTLKKFIPIEQWTKQYLLQKWRGHVFCKPGLACGRYLLRRAMYWARLTTSSSMSMRSRLAIWNPDISVGRRAPIYRDEAADIAIRMT